MPFFLLGYGLKRFAAVWNTGPTKILIVLLFVVVFVLRYGHWQRISDMASPVIELLSLFVGVLAVAVLVLFRDPIRLDFLAWLGPFAFGVYVALRG